MFSRVLHWLRLVPGLGAKALAPDHLRSFSGDRHAKLELALGDEGCWRATVSS